MKLGILGDLHLRASRPVNRIDDYFMTQFQKIQQAFETFADEGCSAVLQPGDWFHDYGKDPYNITNDAIALLMLYRIPVYLVFGQHDIKFHNKDISDVPIQTLNRTDLVTQLSHKPHTINIGGKKVKLYGANWDEPIPRAKRRKNVVNILVAHTMVIKNKKLWPQQTDYTQARKLPEMGYDLVVSGDNHQAFTLKNKVINCGSLMRMKTDQKDHTPMFGIYDTLENTLDVRYYDVQPSEAVLKLKEKEEEKNRNSRKQSLITSFNTQESDQDIDEKELDYRRNVRKVIRKQRKKINTRTKDIVEESLSSN